MTNIIQHFSIVSLIKINPYAKYIYAKTIHKTAVANNEPPSCVRSHEKGVFTISK